MHSAQLGKKRANIQLEAQRKWTNNNIFQNIHFGGFLLIYVVNDFDIANALILYQFKLIKFILYIQLCKMLEGIRYFVAKGENYYNNPRQHITFKYFT